MASAIHWQDIRGSEYSNLERVPKTLKHVWNYTFGTHPERAELDRTSHTPLRMEVFSTRTTNAMEPKFNVGDKLNLVLKVDDFPDGLWTITERFFDGVTWRYHLLGPGTHLRDQTEKELVSLIEPEP